MATDRYLSKTPKAMVILASEQLWPNLHGLVYWHQHCGGVDDLCIYSTDDPVRSITPAYQIHHFCDELFPNIDVHMAAKPGGIEPDAVFQQVLQWQQQLPDRYWIINATGGLKLMFAGLIDLVGSPQTEVVYRELSGDWYKLDRNEGRIVATKIDVAVSATDSIPVSSLVDVLWKPPHGARWLWAEPTPLPIVDITRAGVACEWNWKQAFESVGIITDKQPGFLFEDYIAGVLLAMGISNAITGVTLLTDTGQALQEIDVIANHGGRLWIIDCKLRSEDDEKAKNVESITSQIRQAAQTQRQFGAGSARLILLRPNRRFSPEERALAREYRLEVIDADDAWELLPRLAKWFGLKELPAEIRAAQDLIISSRRAGAVRVFSRTSAKMRYLAQFEESPALVNLDGMLAAAARERGQDWWAAQFGGKLWLRCGNPRRLKETQLAQLIRDVFSRFGSVSDLRISNSGSSCVFSIKVSSDISELVQYLQSRIGKELLGDVGIT
ncbi:MAG: hypothetical protein KatS3mg110_0459 [Pirellulaceae bacterium]|nr:MAG: hypothetical protein KatS3mg110_0459 [Pirellulaceae bacterium]